MGERSWLRTAPLAGRRPSHPLLVDLLEDALWHCPDNDLLRAASTAAAPTWAALHEWSPMLARVEGGRRDANHVLQGLTEQGSSASQYFLLNGAAIAVASLGQSFGALLWPSSSYSLADRVFLSRLMAESERSGFEVLYVDPADRFGRTAVPGVLVAALAACPQGAPLDAIDAIQADGRRVAAHTWRGPADRVYGFVEHPSPTDPHSAAELLDVWAPDGWDYLRRGGAVAVAGTAGQRYRDYDPYLLGIVSLDPELALAYLAATSEDMQGGSSEEEVRIDTVALRLATSIATEQALGQAAALGARALRCVTAPKERLEVLLDLANAHALRRRVDELDRAAALCAEARLLLTEGDGVNEVRLLNLEALVAYHRGDSSGAVALEIEALDVARAAGTGGTRGMVPTLRRNLARVLHRRVDDTAGAVALLRENAIDQTAARSTQMSDLLTLASLHFDECDHSEVVSTLEARGYDSLDLEQQVVAYVLHIRSLVALGEREQAERLLPGLASAMRLLGCDSSFHSDVPRVGG